MNKNITEIVKNYRNEIDRHDGIVIIFENEVQGWMDELRRPEGWVPGCIAVDPKGKQFITAGGNGYAGAKKWKVLN